jgi:hypothetical protein
LAFFGQLGSHFARAAVYLGRTTGAEPHVVSGGAGCKKEGRQHTQSPSSGIPPGSGTQLRQILHRVRRLRLAGIFGGFIGLNFF